VGGGDPSERNGRLLLEGLEIFVKLLFQVFLLEIGVDKAPFQLPRLRRPCCCWKKLIIIPHLWPKQLKNQTLWDRPYLHSPYKGVLPGHQRLSPIPVRVQSHHLTICFARRRNQRQTTFMANYSGVVRKNGKGSSPINTNWETGLPTSACASIWTFFWKVSWSHLLIFFHCVFYEKRTADNGKGKVNFRSMSASSALMYQQLLLFSEER